MYRYIREELPVVVAEHFAIDTTRSGIFGHSMGGHGALTIALRNPQQFRSVSAFAPIVAPRQVPWGEKALPRYLGEHRAAWDSHEAFDFVQPGTRHQGPIPNGRGSWRERRGE